MQQKIEGENNSAHAVYVAGGDTSGVALTGYLNDTGAHQKVLQLLEKDSVKHNNHLLFKSKNVALLDNDDSVIMYLLISYMLKVQSL